MNGNLAPTAARSSFERLELLSRYIHHQYKLGVHSRFELLSVATDHAHRTALDVPASLIAELTTFVVVAP